VPGVPVGVLASAGFGRVLVSWSAPATDGGWPVSGYVVRAFSAASGGVPVAGRSCAVSVPAAGPVPLSCVVSGLVNGTR